MNTIPQPSVKSLILACIISIILATIILFVAVLPAEYNIDPTGLGSKLGLTVLSQAEGEMIKPSVFSCSDNASSTDKKLGTEWKDTVIITLPPKKGLEYKFSITKDETFEFEWSTADKTKLYFDFHGEPKGDKTGFFKSFKENTDNQSGGFLVAPFTGAHGWYWENKTNQTVIIILKTRGNYKIIGLL
ncbi:MAG: hypothetical protein KAH20_09370 [Methylococcales bacterium]|nr:hypothetical protein [Methylococcales bacterium]